MINIIDSASLGNFLDSCPYPDLLELLRMRIEQLDIPADLDFSDCAQFVVVEPGDEMEAIETAIGFSPLEDRTAGVRYPHSDFTPSWEWVLDHGDWFEAPTILSDDGFGVVLWVKSDSGVPADLLVLLKS